MSFQTALTKVSGDDYLIPVGIIILSLDTEDMVCAPIHPIISDLHYLRNNLREWLCRGVAIIQKYNKPLKEYVFINDLKILQKVLKNKNLKYYHKTIRDIVSNNTIMPAHLKDLLELIKSPIFAKYDRKPQKYLTKFMALDENKISSIINNQIYASFPEDFNDVFDSQLRLNIEIKSSLAEKYQSGGQYCPFVDYYQDFFNSSNICCFSKLNPISCDSNHMWGLYANSGNGIALEYNIDDMIKFIVFNLPKSRDDLVELIGIPKANISPSVYDHSRMLSVEYTDNSKFTWFENYLLLVRDRLGNNNLTQESFNGKLIESFHTTKSTEWQFEQEVRFISLNYVMSNGNNTTHPVNMSKYMSSTNAHDLLHQNKKEYSKSIPFIDPERIVLGWKLKSYNFEQYAALISNLPNIQFIELDDTLNYTKNEFNLK